MINEINQGKKLNILDDFENKTPKHMSVTNVISKIEKKILKLDFQGTKTPIEKSSVDFKSRNSTL